MMGVLVGGAVAATLGGVMDWMDWEDGGSGDWVVPIAGMAVKGWDWRKKEDTRADSLC